MDEWRRRIVVDPKVMLGKPVIAGTRIPVEHILRKLAASMSVEAILRDYPRLTREDIQAALSGCAILKPRRGGTGKPRATPWDTGSPPG
jgi:uncharacterized protein (DUF433 family)